MSDTITIFGKGKMGQAISSHFTAAGQPVQIIGREKQAIKGKIVIFAIPFEAMEDIITTYGDELNDKILVDISNPLDYQTKQSTLQDGESTSLILSEKYPALTILKAFNTTFSSSRLEGAVKPKVLFAGDDPAAKGIFSEALSKGNFSPIDAGSLLASKDLEAFARVQLALLMTGELKPLEDFAL